MGQGVFKIKDSPITATCGIIVAPENVGDDAIKNSGQLFYENTGQTKKSRARRKTINVQGASMIVATSIIVK